MKRVIYTVLLGVSFIGGTIFGFWAKDWFDVDACLDAGGAWDYRIGSCVTE